MGLRGSSPHRRMVACCHAVLLLGAIGFLACGSWPGKQFEPVSVRSIQEGDIVYSRLDFNGFVTTITYMFREYGPDPIDPEKGFTIRRTAAEAGAVELYRLRNVATSEVQDFRGVRVARGRDSIWRITEAGHRQIREELEKHLRVRFGRIPAR